jgi:hypothetical protein
VTAILYDGFQEYRLDPGVRRIGRDRRYCDLVFEDELLSRIHACLVGSPRHRWLVLDLRSSNGTIVNGVPVRYRALEDLDAIEVGSTRLVFREDPDAPEDDGPWMPPGARERLAPALAADLADDHLARARRSTFDRLVATQSAGRLALAQAGSPRLPEELARRSRELLGGRWAWVLAREGGGGAWEAAAVNGERVGGPRVPAVARQLADLATEGSRALLTAGPGRDPWLRDAPGEDLGPALAAPLRVGNEVRAALVVGRETGGDLYDEDDRVTLERYAGFAGAAWGASFGSSPRGAQ